MIAKLKALIGLAGRADATAAELLPTIPQAEAELQAALAAQAEVERDYKANLLNPDDAVMSGILDAQRATKLRVDRAGQLLTTLRDRLAAAQEADRQAEVDRLHGEADAAASAYRQAVEQDLPLMAEAVRRMLRLGAEAELAREAAMRADPSAPPRPAVEAFRASASLPRQEVGEAYEIELWCRENGEPLSEEQSAAVQPQGDGTGFLRHGSQSTRFTKKRRFRRVEVLDADFGQAAEPLAKVLSVPGTTMRDQPGWRALDSADPRAVLAALDRLERHVEPAGDTRQARVVLEPTGDLIEISGNVSVLDRLAGRRAS